MCLHYPPPPSHVSQLRVCEEDSLEGYRPAAGDDDAFYSTLRRKCVVPRIEMHIKLVVFEGLCTQLRTPALSLLCFCSAVAAADTGFPWRPPMMTSWGLLGARTMRTMRVLGTGTAVRPRRASVALAALPGHVRAGPKAGA